VEGLTRHTVLDADEAAETGQVDLANAVDLDESESEEELEDLIDDFAAQADEVRAFPRFRPPQLPVAPSSGVPFSVRHFPVLGMSCVPHAHCLQQPPIFFCHVFK
jgi:hypothetical protein